MQRWWRPLLVVALLAVTLVVAPAGTAAAAITPGEFEQCLLDKINADRADVGSQQLVMAADRVDQVRAWSEWMRHNSFRHMTSVERNPILPTGTFTWGENIAMWGSPNLSDCSQIHNMFMNSKGHRDNILRSGFRYAALGAYVDGSGWWVTELFFDASGYSPECNGTFCDDDTSTFEADIERIAAAGITRGCNPPTNDRFCPSDYVTRGQMAAFLVRALGLSGAGSVDFVDDDGSTFESDIEKMAAAGITQGCNPPTNNRFCPDDRVTRGVMAAFLARALHL